MTPSRLPRFLTLAVLALWVGCATKAVVLSPGAVPMPADADRYDGPAAWSLSVSEARDARPPNKAGQRVGTLYTRFEKTPQPAFLEQNPEFYVKEQLSLYLLHRGLEASDPKSAKALLTVSVEEFSVTENPGSLYDEVVVAVGYTVHFADRENRELGVIRLEGSKQVKAAMKAKTDAEEAFREILADTFAGLTKSTDFNRILKELE